jgi:hypothetical protein
MNVDCFTPSSGLTDKRYSTALSDTWVEWPFSQVGTEINAAAAFELNMIRFLVMSVSCFGAAPVERPGRIA